MGEQKIQDEHWSRDNHDRRTPDHPVVEATFAPFAAIVASAVDGAGASSVLDVGCGNGYLQWALEKRFGRVAGVDRSARMLEVNPCKEKYLGSSEGLPFADGSFDVAVASHLLHHLEEPARIRTLMEMRRVASRAVISFEPNRTNPLVLAFSLLEREERMAWRFSPGYMRGLFVKTGLLSVHVHVEGWLVPNKAPCWWIPIGRMLGKTPLRSIGFDICCVAARPTPAGHQL
ncbi:MAG: class I SAM-dependent methyltransferase [Elusimicrobia bacterium]|nr:class I SAM-dependent methyltransferase [Elusimicrobiota bacterium]